MVFDVHYHNDWILQKRGSLAKVANQLKGRGQHLGEAAELRTRQNNFRVEY